MISYWFFLATEVDPMEKLPCVQKSQNLIDVLRIALLCDIGGPKNTRKYQRVTLQSESCIAQTKPCNSCPLSLHLMALCLVNMAALFGLAWAWHRCVDVHLLPKPKLALWSMVVYLAGTDPQGRFIKAQGCIVSLPVTMSGQPDGQLDVTAAKPGG